MNKRIRAAAVITAAIPCGSCNGAGGRTETTNEGGVTRSTWYACGSCHGAGTR